MVIGNKRGGGYILAMREANSQPFLWPEPAKGVFNLALLQTTVIIVQSLETLANVFIFADLDDLIATSNALHRGDDHCC